MEAQIEELDEVERAFVHVDYLPRDAPEHKARPLAVLQGLRPSVCCRLRLRSR
jgi:hypothetical protein